MKNTRELISEELRSIRAKKKLSIEDVAKNSNISKDTISRYENNVVSMQIDTLEKLLVFYGIDFNIFFTNIYANKHNFEQYSIQTENKLEYDIGNKKYVFDNNGLSIEEEGE